MRNGYNFLQWVLLISLTVVLLLWPVHYYYKYQAVQSLSVFDNIFLFGGLFLLWMALLILNARQGGFLTKALLVCIFASVYSCFWLVNCPYIGGASFDPGGVAYVKYILEHGNIVLGNSQWGYFEFPLTSIIGALFSQITGLSVFATSKILLVVASLLLPLSAYILGVRFFAHNAASFFTVIIAILASAQLALMDVFFRPGTMGFLALAPILVLMSSREGMMGETAREKVLLALILVMVAITHFISSVAIFFILVGVYLYQRIAKRELISLKIIILSTAINLVWWLYVSKYTTVFVLQSFADFLQNPYSVTLNFALRRGQMFLTEQVPMWASMVRAFWIVFAYALPTLIVLAIYVKAGLFRKKDANLAKVKGALLGIFILTIVMTLADRGANRSVGQFFLFSTFLAPFILVSSLSGIRRKFTRWNRKAVFGFLAILVVLLSLPTFLANNPSVNTQIFYNKENSAFAFLQTDSGQGGQIQIFSDIETGYLQRYYLPNGELVPIPYPPDYVVNQADFPDKLQKYMLVYEQSSDSSFFVYSPRISHFSYMQLGIPTDDPVWNKTVQDLQSQNKIYDNSFDWIVKP